MDYAHAQGAIIKRTTQACQRCRRQKIKCTGSRPCENCRRRNLSCSFYDRDQKVVVTRGFISDLTDKINDLAQRAPSSAVLPISLQDSETPGSSRTGYHQTQLLRPGSRDSQAVGDNGNSANHEEIPSSSTVLGSPQSSHDPDDSTVATTLTNPFSTGDFTGATDSNGRTWFLGTSSNWSFACRVLSIANHTAMQEPFAPDTLLFDGTAYMAEWDRLTLSAETSEPTLPSRDHSLYLINTVKFHLGHLFHLFDEETFMFNFHRFYQNPHGTVHGPGLWYIQYLLILAFGKAFVVHKTKQTPPGAEFFAHAEKRLPEMTNLCRDPMNATEILCCIALYFQALDFRSSAYNFVGLATRIALVEGYHTDMQGKDLDDSVVERCRKIWWTIYILDRQMTSLLGVPIALREDDISARLPSFSGSSYDATIYDIHVRLSKVMAQVVKTVYGPEGRLDKQFLLSMKSALTHIAEVTTLLRDEFEMPCDERLQDPDRLHSARHTPTGTIKFLLQSCVDSAQRMLTILSELQKQNLIETFLPFDLEATFLSAIVLVMARLMGGLSSEHQPSWLRIAYSILDEMESRGNVIAQSRKKGLEHLERAFEYLTAHVPDTDMAGAPQHTMSAAGRSVQQYDKSPADLLSTAVEEGQFYPGYEALGGNWPESFSAMHLQSVVDSFGASDFNWLLDTMPDDTGGG
ncbi:hypothetical protein KCU88_g6965, partial [Aureobasidium melanogenum]